MEKADARALLGIGAGASDTEIEASFSPLEKYNMELLARVRDQKRTK